MAKRRPNNSGSVIKRGKVWQTRYYDYDLLTGKSVRRSKNFSNHADAISFLAEVQYKKDHQESLSPPDIDLAAFIRDYFYPSYQSKNNKPETLRMTDAILRLHILPSMGSLPLSKITPVIVQAFFNSLINPKTGNQYSFKYIKNIHTTVHMVFSHAVAMGFITKSPLDSIIKPCGKKAEERKPLSVDEASELIIFIKDNEPEEYYYLLHTMILTGMRIGEALGLTWNKVDFDKNTITVDQQLDDNRNMLCSTKTSNTRTFIMPGQLRTILLEWRGLQNHYKKLCGKSWSNTWGLVFTHQDGSHLTEPRVRSHLVKGKVSIGRSDLKLHDLRHSFATIAAENGIPPTTLARMLGHKNPNITMQYYAHSTDVGLVAGAEVIDSVMRKLPSA